jgi:hypothetical protein
LVPLRRSHPEKIIYEFLLNRSGIIIGILDLVPTTTTP